MPDALTGRLLVATPLLDEPNFRRAVVFVCSHTDDGAFGVILNRPLEEPVDEQLPDWARRTDVPHVFFSGGPVDPDRVIALALNRTGREPQGWSLVAPEVGLVDLSMDADELSPSIEAVRLFSGYAGWGGGQLEHEIGEQSWFVVDSRPSDVFSRTPLDLWRAVLRRQASPLAIYSTFPSDVALN